MRHFVFTIACLGAVLAWACYGIAADQSTQSNGRNNQSTANSSSASTSNSADSENYQSRSATSENSAAGGAYLGVAVESISPVLAKQLPNLLPNGSGIVVTEVAKDSPAAKAGIQRDDILVTFDDQRLYSPDQLLKMIRNDKAQREVKLGVVHEGKLEHVSATLGGRESSANGESSQSWQQHPWLGALRPLSPDEEAARWKSFDSLTLSRTGDNNFKAEIKFRDDTGKLETHDFKGTRQQIRKDINAQQDLPSSERQQLLRAISLASNPWEAEFPFVGFIPNPASSVNSQPGQYSNDQQSDHSNYQQSNRSEDQQANGSNYQQSNRSDYQQSPRSDYQQAERQQSDHQTQ